MVSHKYANLQQIVGKAIHDEAFRSRLLNDDRPEVIAGFDLDQDEREAILAIKADSLEGFARELLCWMKQHGGV